MTENIYSAPKSETLAVQGPRGSLYSPTQVACGTIGGPIGLIYFLKANFDTLENYRASKLTVVCGVIFILVLIAVIPFLPAKLPNSPFTIAYVVIARLISERYQMTKQAISISTQYKFHSNWRVFGIGLLCLLGSAIVLVTPLALLEILGIWKP